MNTQYLFVTGVFFVIKIQHQTTKELNDLLTPANKIRIDS